MPDHCEEAESLFRNVADELGLKIEKKAGDPVELSMVIPKQEGLKFDVWLGLQNDDELWFCVGDAFTCSLFPFSKEKDKFTRYLKSTLSGKWRIVTYTRPGKQAPLMSELQEPTPRGREAIYVYGRRWGSVGSLPVLGALLKHWLKADILTLRER